MAIDTIKATAILDGAVDTADLADDAVTNAKIASGAVDTTELASDAVTTAKIPDDAVTTAKIPDDAITGAKVVAEAINESHWGGHQLGGRRNLIINGAMKVTQRGTTVTGKTSGAYYTTVDRIEFNSDFPTGVTSVATSQETDAPDGFSNSFKIEPEQARTAALSGADRMFINYKVEAQDLQHLQYGSSSAKALTFSFWIKSNLTGVVSIEVGNPDANSNYQNYHEEVSISSADTWEYKTVSISGNQNGGIDNNNDTGLVLTIIAAAGPSFTDGTWTTGVWHDTTTGDRASSSNIDFYSSASNYVKITGLQLEVGDTATPFEHRSYGEELALCQRYYQTFSSGMPYVSIFLHKNGYYESQPFVFPVEMRTSPTMTYGSITVRALNGSSNTSITGEALTVQKKAFHAYSATTNNSNFHTFIINAPVADAEL